MSEDVISTFAVRDRGWSRAAEARLSALGLTVEAVNRLLAAAAAYLQESGEVAVDTYGAAEEWATEQVNMLAEEGALEMRPLPWESGRQWLRISGLFVASFYATFGVFQLFGFVDDLLPVVWIPIGGLLGLFAALGAWGQYVVTPRTTTGGWIVSAAGTAPGMFVTVALWFTGQHSPGVDATTVFWGLLDQTLLSDTLLDSRGLSTIWWFGLAGALILVSSPWKLWQARDLLPLRRSEAYSKSGVATKDELSNWRWKGRLRRLAYYRWHLDPKSVRQLEEHFVRDSASGSLHRAHGAPAQALAWTAPTYRVEPAYVGHDWFEPRLDMGPAVAPASVAGVFVASQVSENSAPWWVVAAAILIMVGSLSLVLLARKSARREFSLQRFKNTTRDVDPVADFYRDAE